MYQTTGPPAISERSPGLRRGAVILLLGGLLLLLLSFRPVVEGDGVNYFAYLHTLVIDHDLDFSDEYRAAEQAGLALNLTLIETRTPTGLVADFQPVGAALLSLPFYLPALVLHPSGEPQFGEAFVTAYTVASLFYGLLALALCLRLAQGVTGSRRAALTGTLAGAAATPYVYYLIWEPGYAHTFSACLAAAFVLLWWRGGRPGARPSAGWWLGLGVIGGAMAAIRYQDGPIIAMVLLDARRARWRLLVFGAGVVAGFAPQILVNHMVFGTWLPYRPAEFALQPWPGHYLEVLLSSHNGLLAWTPAAVAAVAGHRGVGDRRLALAALYAFVVELAIEGAAPDWWGGHSFGMRRLLVLMPFAIVGLSALASRLGPRLAAAGAAALVAWNLLLVANFEYVLKSDRDPGYRGLFHGQLDGLRYLPRLFSQGGVLRDLILWAPLHRPFDPLRGLTLLVLEAACLSVAVAVAWRAQTRSGRP